MNREDSEAAPIAPPKNTAILPKPGLSGLPQGIPSGTKNACAILADPEQPSTMKAVALQGLRKAPVDEAVPAIMAFLESPPTEGSAYVKPTAVKVLVDFRHPVADKALRKLARGSRDEHVRRTIAVLFPQGAER